MNDVTREKEDQTLFDGIAEHYSRKDLVASSSLARRNQLLSAIEPLLAELPNLGTVVDIGCGVGAPARYLADHYERYIGIDQSKEMIRAARAFNQGNARAEFLVDNAKSINLPPNTADLVLSIGALHHMTELEAVMDSLVRIAQSGAALVAIEPQNGNPVLQMMRRVRAYMDPSYSSEQVFFSERDLTDLFAGHGITHLRIDYQGFLAPPFAQVIVHPQTLFVPMSRMASRIDSWFTTHVPRLLRKLSFNIVIIGTIIKPDTGPERGGTQSE